MRRWGLAACLLGMGLTATLLFPMESRADPNPESYSHHGGHQGDFASRALRALLHEQPELNLSDEQVGKIKTLALDYAKTRIRDEAEVKLAEVDAFALIVDEKADLSAVEAALRKSEQAKTVVRLDRVKAMRAAGAVLTPEQRDKWQARMKERHWEGRHGEACGGRLGSHDRSKSEG
jgi:Spy/CpxP family protein refolding chaperone